MFEPVNDLVEARYFGDEIKPATTSLKVAEYFEKEHFHVMRDIKDVISKCSESFNASNFGLVEYTDTKGQKRPMYLLTRDGFTMVAMGYTGTKAMQFKERYIAAFNKMEERLRSMQPQQVLPQNYIEALKALVNAEEARQRAERKLESVEADMCKALRDNDNLKYRLQQERMTLEDQLDFECFNTTYKKLAQIAWLREFFDMGTYYNAVFQNLGCRLSALSKAMGIPYIKMDHTYAHVPRRYHINVIEEFRRMLENNPSLMRKYRID